MPDKTELFSFKTFNTIFYRSKKFRWILGILWFVGLNPLYAQRLSRDLNVSILINQAGYMPYTAKYCITESKVNRIFEVLDIVTQEVVYKGTMQAVTGDFGSYATGDFSQVTKEGHYYIKADTLRSYPFTISTSVYQDPMKLIVHYFSLQRCGASTTGYLSPCHLDDGIRMDNGKHQDVTGGWHDASDLRKWVGATIYGMIGLGKAYELTDQNKDHILDELKWGNHYFLNMQEPRGYVMNYVGGDVQKHSDSNRWTDNETGPDGGELHMTKPNAGESMNDMLIFDTNDDRVIRTDPLDIGGQYTFITAEAIMSRITAKSDREYSKRCLLAAENCFEWCLNAEKKQSPGIIGPALQSALELYKTTLDDKYRYFAIEQANQLIKLQAGLDKNNFGGFFFESPDQKEPHKNISRGCWEFISLCDLVKLFPTHNNVPVWKGIIADYAYHYLSYFTGKNNFGIVPFGLYTDSDPGGNRKAGDYWYRYFMQPELDWWVGINANLASAGVGLYKAGVVLKDDKLKSLAQRQLDWIIGVNPFNSSTLIGVGYNHPRHFPGSSFLPNVPELPGAVLNGLGGTHDDQPQIGNGNWQISEYWTPMVAYTLWLMAEMSE